MTLRPDAGDDPMPWIIWKPQERPSDCVWRRGLLQRASPPAVAERALYRQPGCGATAAAAAPLSTTAQRASAKEMLRAQSCAPPVQYRPAQVSGEQRSSWECDQIRQGIDQTLGQDPHTREFRFLPPPCDNGCVLAGCWVRVEVLTVLTSCHVYTPSGAECV